MRFGGMLDGGPAPEAPFDGLEVLIPAREFRNRHKSILLALEATAEADGGGGARRLRLTGQPGVIR